ncbi:signal peptidase I [Candidatus Saccharibacteria bacterium]|nr:signal peptidase I [Candidatus Saccharibacteria bacterium]
MHDPDEPISDNNKQSKKEGWRSIASTLFIIIAAPVIALLLINFVFQSYEVDGPSMESTLQNTDRLIVWKMPRTIAKIKGSDYIPNRGDIIIFKRHGAVTETGSTDKQLIKRVIGLPGDRVVIKSGKVTIYNEENVNGFNPDAGVDHGNNTAHTDGNVDITVNEDEVFVLGDNRSNSLDSRFFGAVKAHEIVGKLEYRIFPFNKFEQF